MRPHPLLALCTATTAVALATVGALDQSAYASRPGRTHHHHPHAVHLELRRPADQAAPETRLSGVMPLTFAVIGGPALGGYVPPAIRRAELAARRRALAIERARLLEERRTSARQEASLLALRRRLLARLAATALHRVYVPAGGVWAELRQCESGGNYGEATGNGYYGAYQFLPSTWWSLGFSGLPSQAPPAVQDRAARLLLTRQGWGAWPACSAALGL